MTIEIYADGADLESMKALANDSRIGGFTTNPSLCKKAGVAHYKDFAQQVLGVIGDKPVSFEVFADDLAGMEKQAKEISSWGPNVYVKIPIINTKGESTAPLIEKLAGKVKLNITAILTKDQINTAASALYGSPGIISVFAGRIADTGKDPSLLMRYAVSRTRGGQTKVLWASTREVLNVMQAEHCGVDIITMSPDLITKLNGLNADLAQVSLATVRQFYKDAEGYSL